jgi:acetyl esterase/lipase
MSLLPSLVLIVSLLMQTPVPNDEGVTLAKDAVEHRDVVYARRDTGDVKLDIFTPPGDGPFPTVLYVHGGGWQGGSKNDWSHMNFLTGEGYAVVNVGYRLSDVAKFPAQFDDVLASVDFIGNNAAFYHFDVKRIVLSGESAGAHLVSLVALQIPPGHVRGVIDLFGPTDLVSLGEVPKSDSIAKLLGGSVKEKPELAKAASPINFVTKNAPPFMIIHGTKDDLVPIAQSDSFAEKLKAAGVKVEYQKIEGAGHAGAVFWTQERREAIRVFLKQNLS